MPRRSESLTRSPRRSDSKSGAGLPSSTIRLLCVRTSVARAGATVLRVSSSGRRITGSQGSENGAYAHPTEAERAARGKAARTGVPRACARRLRAGLRPADPIALLEEQAASRVPELVPIRYGRMLVSPFTFYRGAAPLMASDLATARAGTPDPALRRRPPVELRRLRHARAPPVFDLNDFDETLPGPCEWDVKRLVASFEVAGRDRGFDRRCAPRIAGGRQRLSRGDAALRGDGNLDVWYARLDVDESRRGVGAGSSEKQRQADASGTSRRRGRRTASRRSRS